MRRGSRRFPISASDDARRTPPMANVLDLEAAVAEHALLFDTTLLIHAYTQQTNVLGRIPRPQRFTSPLAVWEFVHLQDGQLINHGERLARRDWMDRQEIRAAWVSAAAERAFQTLLWHSLVRRVSSSSMMLLKSGERC